MSCMSLFEFAMPQLWQDYVKNMPLWVSKELWDSMECILIFRNIDFCRTLYPLEILEIIRSWKYLKNVWKENLWASGPNYRRSSRKWPESWLQLPTKLARMTGKHGLIGLKGHDGAENGRTRSCTEGVRLLNILIKMLHFLSQYYTLPSVKKRWGWGLPL